MMLSQIILLLMTLKVKEKVTLHDNREVSSLINIEVPILTDTEVSPQANT